MNEESELYCICCGNENIHSKCHKLSNVRSDNDNNNVSSHISNWKCSILIAICEQRKIELLVLIFFLCFFVVSNTSRERRVCDVQVHLGWHGRSRISLVRSVTFRWRNGVVEKWPLKSPPVWSKNTLNRKYTRAVGDGWHGLGYRKCGANENGRHSRKGARLAKRRKRRIKNRCKLYWSSQTWSETKYKVNKIIRNDKVLFGLLSCLRQPPAATTTTPNLALHSRVSNTRMTGSSWLRLVAMCTKRTNNLNDSCHTVELRVYGLCAKCGTSKQEISQCRGIVDAHTKGWRRIKREKGKPKNGE